VLWRFQVAESRGFGVDDARSQPQLAGDTVMGGDLDLACTDGSGVSKKQRHVTE
jgi:hypothetical protein